MSDSLSFTDDTFSVGSGPAEISMPAVEANTFPQEDIQDSDLDNEGSFWPESHLLAAHDSFEQPGPDSIPLSFPAPPSDLYAMRKHWIQVARSSHSIEEGDVRKVFSKNQKSKTATVNTLKASALRRKHPAKFKCPIDGCNDDFTRKHNLENHLRAHCGVTDLICPICDKGFTTIPVWKRHQKTCARTASRTDAENPRSFLAMIRTESDESKVLES